MLIRLYCTVYLGVAGQRRVDRDMKRPACMMRAASILGVSLLLASDVPRRGHCPRRGLDHIVLKRKDCACNRETVDLVSLYKNDRGSIPETGAGDESENHLPMTVPDFCTALTDAGNPGVCLLHERQTSDFQSCCLGGAVDGVLRVWTISERNISHLLLHLRRPTRFQTVASNLLLTFIIIAQFNESVKILKTKGLYKK